MEGALGLVECHGGCGDSHCKYLPRGFKTGKCVFVFLAFNRIIYFFEGEFIIPKWLILTPGDIAILFGTFWNNQTCDQIWTPGPLICYKIQQKYKKNYEHIFENVSLVNAVPIFEKMKSACTKLFEIWDVVFGCLEIETLTMRNL